MNTPWKGPVMVTLVNGSMVFSDSEAWRHETEARMLLNDYSTEGRASMLAAIGKQRGADAVEGLLDTMAALRAAKGEA